MVKRYVENEESAAEILGRLCMDGRAWMVVNVIEDLAGAFTPIPSDAIPEACSVIERGGALMVLFETDKGRTCVVFEGESEEPLIRPCTDTELGEAVAGGGKADSRGPYEPA